MTGGIRGWFRDWDSSGGGGGGEGALGSETGVEGRGHHRGDGGRQGRRRGFEARGGGTEGRLCPGEREPPALCGLTDGDGGSVATALWLSQGLQ